MSITSRAPNQSIPRIIEVVRARGEVSRRVIAAETGLSTPSVTRLVNELIEAGLLAVEESIIAEGAGPGRPASVIKLNPDCACAIGVDVGERFIQIALCDMNGAMKLTSKLPTQATEGGDVTSNAIVNAIADILEQHRANGGEGASPLRAIAVGAPGTVDPATSRVVSAPMIKGWTDFDLKRRLESSFPDVSLRIVNDINAAAIGEFASGVAKGIDNFVFASIRRGIGAGIFIDGRLYEGHSGFAGEMGKMVFDTAFKFSQSDGLGHLETKCGEDAVVDQAKSRGVILEAKDSSSLPLNVLATAAADGDQDAVSILSSFIEQYGLAIANVASLLDPSIIVLGGDIHPAMELVVDQLTASIKELIPSPPPVVGSSLGDRVCLQGATYQAHKDACSRLLSCQTV